MFSFNEMSLAAHKSCQGKASSDVLQFRDWGETQLKAKHVRSRADLQCLTHWEWLSHFGLVIISKVKVSDALQCA